MQGDLGVLVAAMPLATAQRRGHARGATESRGVREHHRHGQRVHPQVEQCPATPLVGGERTPAGQPLQ